MADHKAILVIGSGDATGSAVACRFARAGQIACVTRRSADKLQPLRDPIRAEGGEAHGVASDARKDDEMADLVVPSVRRAGRAPIPAPERPATVGGRRLAGRPATGGGPAGSGG
jgi:NAD(P)-dependent dehydrogenase (short-subunit alcohol dehydrogenase family)